MQFKHPEILYALFLLLIPIIIHLFQLRRFEKVNFTNVQFLKKVELKTRKSSKLKKLLVLLSRLSLFATLIIAFSQPYYSELSKNQERHIHVYLDNSLSMQAKGDQGELFRRAIQDIIDVTDTSPNISLYTNNNKWASLTSQDLKNTLLSLNYHPIQKPINSILLDIQNSIRNQKKIANDIFLISDFQHMNKVENLIALDSFATYNFTQLIPNKRTNISIDSMYITSRNSENILLKVIAKNYNAKKRDIPISLYDENVLLGKSTINIAENESKEIEFKIPFKTNINGRITTVDEYLSFDNDFYFTINQTDKINVLVIGEETTFLEKVYTIDEFNYTSNTLNQLDYNSLLEQNLIILNEIELIPSALIDILSEAARKGSNIVIIPSVTVDENSYGRLFSSLNIGTLGAKSDIEVQITDINFSHPFYENVFEKSIENFQYPKIESHYSTSLRNKSTLVGLENRAPFVAQIKKPNSTFYWFAGALNSTNSNFKNSPLIVPVFYNFGKYSYKISQPAYTIGNGNEIEIKATLQKDDILEIITNETSFIPIQQVGNSSVKMIMNDTPLKDGIYSVMNKEEVIQNIAFNYDRRESDLNYGDIKNNLAKFTNVNYYNSVRDAFNISNKAYDTSNLWQLFLGASLLFLFLEILLIKFFKP